MGSFRPSFVLLFLFGFLCLVSGNPISGLFGKSDDGTAEEGKDVKDATIATTTATTPTSTSSSCSGLGSFFHLCDKDEPTEPPKKMKREVSDEDSSDEDSSDSDESTEEKAKEEATTASNSEGEVVKRQVGDPEAPVLGEVPPVVEEAMKAPEMSNDQDEETKEKRQAEETDEKDDQDDSEDMEETSRRRRDCRDSDGDYDKDCRKKREYVPPCFGLSCKIEQTTAADTKEGA